MSFIKAFTLILAAASFVASAPLPLEKRNCSPSQIPNGPDIGIRDQIVRICMGMSGCDDVVMLSLMETAITESGVNDLPCGDRQSFGVYQQQSMYGWGTKEQIMDVDYSTRSYLRPAIQLRKEHPGWRADQIAQGVQNAIAGDRYLGNEGLAREYIAAALAAIGKSGPPSSPPPSSSGGGAVNVENTPPKSSAPKSSSSGSGACTKHYTPHSGEYCIEVAQNHGIPLSTFMKLNPSINSACTNMMAGVPYCVGN